MQHGRHRELGNWLPVSRSGPALACRVKTGWEGQPGLGAALPHRSKLEKDKDAWSRCAQVGEQPLLGGLGLACFG